MSVANLIPFKEEKHEEFYATLGFDYRVGFFWRSSKIERPIHQEQTWKAVGILLGRHGVMYS